MTKLLRCDDVVPGCEAQVRAESDEEVVRQAAEHARAAHGMDGVDGDTEAAIRGAIRSDG